MSHRWDLAPLLIGSLVGKLKLNKSHYVMMSSQRGTQLTTGMLTRQIDFYLIEVNFKEEEVKKQ